MILIDFSFIFLVDMKFYRKTKKWLKGNKQRTKRNSPESDTKMEPKRGEGGRFSEPDNQTYSLISFDVVIFATFLIIIILYTFILNFIFKK